MNEKDESAWYTKGIVSAALGRDHEAIDCYGSAFSLVMTSRLPSDRALAVDPEFVAAVDRKGESYRRLGLVDKAKEMHELVCRHLDPMRIRAWVNLASLHLALGARDTALSVVDEGVSVVGPDKRLVQLRETVQSWNHDPNSE